jgi:hypothetical protein
MYNLKISTRLTMLISVLSALLVAIGSLGVFGIGNPTMPCNRSTKTERCLLGSWAPSSR